MRTSLKWIEDLVRGFLLPQEFMDAMTLSAPK